MDTRAASLATPSDPPSSDFGAMNAEKELFFANQFSRWNLCRKRCSTGANTTPMLVMNASPLNKA